jgi:hypothetical protein
MSEIHIKGKCVKTHLAVLHLANNPSGDHKLVLLHYNC